MCFRLLACLGFIVLSACGGTVATVGGATDAGDGGSDAKEQEAGSDSQPANDGGSPGDGSSSCDALNARIDALRQQALQCCPTCNILQCSHLIEDICCPLDVTDPSSPAVVAFENDVALYKSMCQYGCTAVVCGMTPSNACDSMSSLCKPPQ